jgi:hypothetical protein
MNLYLLEPEVAGGLGENTIIKRFEDNQSKVYFLHYKFSGWLGDELLETTPCFIVTESLSNDLLQNNLTGIKFEPVQITTNEEFDELFPNIKLPSFKRLVPLGAVKVEGTNFQEWTKHDFSLSESSSLVVTKKALLILQTHKLNYCDITVLSEE